MPNTIQGRIVHDEELIVRLQRGDEWAFQLLVRRFREKLFSVAFGITLDAKESREIVRDVFSQVYRGILDFKGDASLSTWLYRITVNHCLNWKRRWGRRLHGFNKTSEQAPPRTETESADQTRSVDAQSREQRRELIDRALKKLSDQARTVFVLRELEDLSYDEIAYVAGLKPENVRSRLFHARRQLRTLLAPVGTEKADQ